MELKMIVTLLEDALRNGLESGIQAVKEGDVEAGLANIERGYAEVASALDALRDFHCPPAGSRVLG